MGNKVAGVIFDLWNTLVPLSDQIKQQAFIETSATLDLEPQKLINPWSETRSRRETGDLYQYLSWMRDELASGWTEETILNAMNVRRDIHGSAFESPDFEAVYVLDRLKKNNIRIAVVSNCSSDVRNMISSSVIEPFIDVIALSAEVGIMKPDPKIYQYAASKLGLGCEQCIYVGDGLDHELEGAEKAGLKAFLLDRGDGIQWSGDSLSRLSDVLKEVGID
ncbi:HAD family hydrolase [Fictibacillus sp. KIGAM418]|uniref:HAD family hydrolase n=1 Tax=Fictibacillus marinisediminis TaxID=2878389 RepID=A0A9X1XDS9_9BACL|nr:HAD family hydrolase [Fictibacillus marinisediminis]MCK6258992.1 HAD family hydrolase [Fictibacillus marinisediminis]